MVVRYLALPAKDKGTVCDVVAALFRAPSTSKLG
jgi:hypothetical protein